MRFGKAYKEREPDGLEFSLWELYRTYSLWCRRAAITRK